MERSFKEEVSKLKLGDGEVFHGEGILAVTKALLQSGVSYVGGYQGAPVSHVMDVLNDAREILDELGVHVETNANEAGAAAMLGASIITRCAARSPSSRRSAPTSPPTRSPISPPPA